MTTYPVCVHVLLVASANETLPSIARQLADATDRAVRSVAVDLKENVTLKSITVSVTECTITP